MSCGNFQSEKILGGFLNKTKKRNILKSIKQRCKDKRKHTLFALFEFNYIFFLKSTLFGSDRVND